MGINSKIAKIPFLILYLISAMTVSFNWIRVILFQKSFEGFRTTQPWDYYLSNLFADVFSTGQREYFIFAFPIILLGLYILPKATGKFMSMDRKSNVKGDNHVATLIILLVTPSLMGMPAMSGIVLLVIFSFLSWVDEQKFKKKI